MDRSYKSALDVLNKRRRIGRPSTQSAKDIPELQETHGLNASDLKGTPSILGMRQWLDELGHSPFDINRLNIIHVAGTKGKGSTCAFIDSFLRAHGKRTGFPRKIGLYTSPHLIHPEERIRINFKPISRDLFAKYFFEVDDILSQNELRDFEPRPRYLQLYALLSFHAFISEGVDAAIYETHHGGEYDSTNIIGRPVVTAITSLGLDHVKQLGSSIDSIAWHKAGIFKSGAAAVSAPQDPAAADILRKRAAEKNVSLQFVSVETDSPDYMVMMRVKPDVQRTNCTVALAAVRSFLDCKTKDNTYTYTGDLAASDIEEGINQFSMPGRFQVVTENQNQWFLDGAHNEMSVSIAAEWFLESYKMRIFPSPIPRILIFGLVTEERDKFAVFERLAISLAGNSVKYAIFTTYKKGRSERMDDPDPDTDTNAVDKSPKDFLPWMPSQDLYAYAEIWKKVQADGNTLFEPTIGKAIEAARNIGGEYGGMQTLITGSQHLVGGALPLLQNLSSHGQG